MGATVGMYKEEQELWARLHGVEGELREEGLAVSEKEFLIARALHLTGELTKLYTERGQVL